jgi:anti-sigma factor RsiW
MTNDISENQPPNGDHEDSHLSLETLSAYLDAELTAEERSAASAHLSACELCQTEFQSLRATTVLMRGLPEMRPARSFHLGPEFAKNTRGAVGSSWLTRMLGLMPALRAATAAVAMLLVVVVAGDVLTNDHGSNPRQSQPVVTTNSTATAPIMITATTEAAPPANTQADSVMMGAPTEPGTDAESAAAAGAAGPEEAAPSETVSTKATEEVPAGEDTQVSSLQVEDSSAADESREDEPGQTSISIEQPAAPIPTATPEPSPTPEPTATTQTTPTSTPSESSGTSEGRASNWRIAEIALGLLLAWLIVTLIGLRRLRHD